jgi:hypothetical protein
LVWRRHLRRCGVLKVASASQEARNTALFGHAREQRTHRHCQCIPPLCRDTSARVYLAVLNLARTYTCLRRCTRCESAELAGRARVSKAMAVATCHVVSACASRLRVRLSRAIISARVSHHAHAHVSRSSPTPQLHLLAAVPLQWGWGLLDRRGSADRGRHQPSRSDGGRQYVARHSRLCRLHSCPCVRPTTSSVLQPCDTARVGTPARRVACDYAQRSGISPAAQDGQAALCALLSRTRMNRAVACRRPPTHRPRAALHQQCKG